MNALPLATSKNRWICIMYALPFASYIISHTHTYSLYHTICNFYTSCTTNSNIKSRTLLAGVDDHDGNNNRADSARAPDLMPGLLNRCCQPMPGLQTLCKGRQPHVGTADRTQGLMTLRSTILTQGPTMPGPTALMLGLIGSSASTPSTPSTPHPMARSN